MVSLRPDAACLRLRSKFPAANADTSASKGAAIGGGVGAFVTFGAPPPELHMGVLL